MKPAVAITLILAGTLLILTPPIADYFWRADAVKVLQKPGVDRVNLRGEISESYAAACYLAGAVMIVVGIVGSWRGERRETLPPA